MGEYGTVTLPIEEYNRLYDADKELAALKDGLVFVTESYSKEPQLMIKAPLNIMQTAWDKVKDKYPEHTFKARHDEEQSIYGVVEKNKPEVEL